MSTCHLLRSLYGETIKPCPMIFHKVGSCFCYCPSMFASLKQTVVVWVFHILYWDVFLPLPLKGPPKWNLLCSSTVIIYNKKQCMESNQLHAGCRLMPVIEFMWVISWQMESKLPRKWRKTTQTINFMDYSSCLAWYCKIVIALLLFSFLSQVFGTVRLWAC